MEDHCQVKRICTTCTLKKHNFSSPHVPFPDNASKLARHLCCAPALFCPHKSHPQQNRQSCSHAQGAGSARPALVLREFGQHLPQTSSLPWKSAVPMPQRELIMGGTVVYPAVVLQTSGELSPGPAGPLSRWTTDRTIMVPDTTASPMVLCAAAHTQVLRTPLSFPTHAKEHSEHCKPDATRVYLTLPVFCSPCLLAIFRSIYILLSRHQRL